MKKKKLGRKWFGYTNGTKRGVQNAVKREDYIKYGYPSEHRNKAELKEHIQDEITKEELKSCQESLETH
jgi:hypothetical protein